VVTSEAARRVSWRGYYRVMVRGARLQVRVPLPRPVMGDDLGR
jgi:hypothetical protein